MLQSPRTSESPVARYHRWRHGVRLWRWAVLPSVLYTAIFLLLTYPAILRVNTRLWAGAGDGLAIFWNLWWVPKALLSLHTHPWFTSYLFHPVGVPLWMHTLHPLKGLMAIPLGVFLNPLCTYNTLLMLSFTLTGLTAFWLCHAFSRAYWPSILGGCVFTFCNYHFAHAQGHLHLVSMEWIPVFLLLWYRLLVAPRMITGLGAALALLLVLFSDSYYFMHSAIAGIVMAAWWAVRSRAPLFWTRRPYPTALVAFILPTLASSGFFVFYAIHAMASDPPTGYFPSWKHSMDLLAPFIPGAHWRFAEWTHAYWSRIPGSIHGNSVNLGMSVWVLIVYAWFRRRDLGHPDVSLWFTLGIFFGVMALGPRLFVAGYPVPHLGDGSVPGLGMPYSLLETLLPPLKVGARPNRMVVIATLSAAVIVSLVVKKLWLDPVRRRLVGWLLLPLMLFEYLPSPLPLTAVDAPAYVCYLATTAPSGALYDMVTPPAKSMYYQTIHERQIPRGWVSREPMRVRQFMERVHAAAAEYRWDRLRDVYDYRFVLVPNAVIASNASAYVGLQIGFADPEWTLYDLGPRTGAVNREN